MDTLMQWLAPRNLFGFLIRLIALIGMVAAANIIFGWMHDEHLSHEPTYYLMHATFVGGPLIAFFLAVTMFQIRLQRRLSHLSRKDGLTGLDNRRTFLERTNKRRKQSGRGVLMMLDADKFKAINDTYGHQAGDACLKAIAYVLQRNLREGDVSGRIGGEEFAIYLQNATVEQARAIGTRFTKPIPFKSEKSLHLTITLSIGAVTEDPMFTLDEMFVAADKALYRAKKNGRAQIIFWDEQLSEPQAMT